jgi:hypothetical protein
MFRVIVAIGQCPRRSLFGRLIKTGEDDRAGAAAACAAPPAAAAERRLFTPRTGRMIFAWAMKYSATRPAPAGTTVAHD